MRPQDADTQHPKVTPLICRGWGTWWAWPGLGEICSTRRMPFQTCRMPFVKQVEASAPFPPNSLPECTGQTKVPKRPSLLFATTDMPNPKSDIAALRVSELREAKKSTSMSNSMEAYLTLDPTKALGKPRNGSAPQFETRRCQVEVLSLAHPPGSRPPRWIRPPQSSPAPSARSGWSAKRMMENLCSACSHLQPLGRGHRGNGGLLDIWVVHIKLGQTAIFNLCFHLPSCDVGTGFQPTAI